MAPEGSKLSLCPKLNQRLFTLSPTVRDFVTGPARPAASDSVRLALAQIFSVTDPAGLVMLGP